MSGRVDVTGLLNELAVPHRAKIACGRIFMLGRDAVAVAEAGLGHENPDVRLYCTLLLDRLAGTDSFVKMLPLLGDPDGRVRSRALHSLACDRCKTDDVQVLDKDTILPLALRVLRDDPDAHVRATAVEVVGTWVHGDPTAADALSLASVSDPSPAVRKKAGWFAPGGPIYIRSQPRRARVQRVAHPA